MLKELATLKVDTQKDYYGEVVRILEENGFTLVETLSSTFETHYIIAKERNNER